MTLSGCVTEPYTGRSQFIFTSSNMEASMSLDSWKQILEKEKPSANAAMCAAVERVGSAIQAVAGKPDYEWEFRVLQSDQANAFCLPGGKVAVYEGLFQYMENDAELACVVAHEVGHALARHGGERMSQAMAVQAGALGLSLALGSQTDVNRERWLMAYTGIATVGYILPYSRTQEYAADQIGLMLMAKAGYDPDAALAFWERFSQKSGGRSTPEFLSTHPVGANRIAKLQELVPKAVLEYEIADQKRGLGAKYAK
ncbi:MAG: hypothetical protein A3K19_14125 [Lentisphaerae bacterium RIFOXYB12_FULL_65_16]|nr:MAG: hypothetical protein A3K18_16360 [Lentisphaerae bacterium RIFOXYA12_64_32]OGV89136.1 MAG: hypothetical protein A3K19_14125 [Lentisphaerae bacterium RIFOXYB12_FULL_65_16]